MRSDYKLERNKQIYEDYKESHSSLNHLAKKYQVSPQRIRFIINEYKEKDLANSLKPTDSKEQRDNLKNRAIEVREAGKPQIAILLFDEVIKWDKANHNDGGNIDVLGHKKICLTLMADKTHLPEKKVEYFAEAEDCIRQGLEIIGDKEEHRGRRAIQLVHLAGLTLERAKAMSDKVQRSEVLRQALETINEGIENLPGSQAHKAWPAANKAYILYQLGQTANALSTLAQATQDLAAGYEDEINSPKDPREQGILKLRVWSSGIQLAYAKILMLENKPYLAEIHASAVVNSPDPTHVLKNRKSEAKKILAEIAKIKN